jgi:hypothetical protein
LALNELEESWKKIFTDVLVKIDENIGYMGNEIQNFRRKPRKLEITWNT